MTLSIVETIAPPARSLLEAAGWYPGRNVSIEAWDDVLRSEGHRLSPAAKEVLTSLGGLTVTPSPAAKYGERLHFEPELAGAGAYDIAERFEVLFGQTFYPIAEWVSNSIVYLGDRGKVVSWDHVEPLDIADSFTEALDVMLVGTRDPRVLPFAF
ncbi:SUKH-3 domain-containing protein [Lentzea sp. BCCO 10_0798]|uniref:SUKH-3 domain-containing protein n=1 Tax=Lentzea kristufekii TaxID=3095430 RepID=A0ABU4TJX2_9PSEU|nr:SUKH-3 domain-containing protein [Lentzea sp. BCCO 10_0798]MDX8048573.1 SUKH-3 domain-containing protein [Lentzea sp. BCCO 10_0798]